MHKFNYKNIVFCDNKKILFNNKFYKKFGDFSKRQDLLFGNTETIYKIIMQKNNFKETFINNYKKDGFIIIEFGKTKIMICDLDFGSLDFEKPKTLGIREIEGTFIY